MTRELFDIFGSNPRDYKISVNELIITFGSINSQLPEQLQEEFIAKFGRIWRSIPVRNTLLAICKYGAATSNTIIEETGISWGSLSRALKVLRKEDLIVPAQKIRSIFSKGGPRPTVWAVKGYEPEDIIQATERHIQASSPTYSEAKRLTQFILDEYMVLKPEWMRDSIKYKEIMSVVRQNTSNYQVADLAKLVAVSLQNQFGVKVWR